MTNAARHRSDSRLAEATLATASLNPDILPPMDRETPAERAARAARYVVQGIRVYDARRSRMFVPAAWNEGARPVLPMPEVCTLPAHPIPAHRKCASRWCDALVLNTSPRLCTACRA